MYFLAKRSSFHSVAEAEVEGVDVRETDLAVLEVGVIHILLQSWTGWEERLGRREAHEGA
jgi:hypothetical protein